MKKENPLPIKVTGNNFETNKKSIKIKKKRKKLKDIKIYGGESKDSFLDEDNLYSNSNPIKK